jgi:hypothetical protein
MEDQSTVTCTNRRSSSLPCCCIRRQVAFLGLILVPAGYNFGGLVVHGSRSGAWHAFTTQLGYSFDWLYHAYSKLPIILYFKQTKKSSQFIFVPYYAWRITHRAHHKGTTSVERDENYVPRTRSDYGLPENSSAYVMDYHSVFEETPIHTLCRMLAMQIFGWQYYLLTNFMGNPTYPAGTNVSWFCETQTNF